MGNETKYNDTRYYVYLFRHPDDGKPVYIGKGTGNRAASHRSDTHNVLLYKFLNEYPEVAPEIVQAGLSEVESFELEKRLISEYGRKIDGSGALFNILEGGSEEYGSPQKIEFKGVCYPSLKSLCLAHDVDYHKVYLRINRYGFSLAEALTKETNEIKRPSLGTAKIIVFRNRTYRSQRQIAEEFGIDYRRLYTRLRSGWPMEEALGLKERKTKKNTGRKGNVIVCNRKPFSSVAELAREYGVKVQVLYDRLRIGWSPEEAVGLVVRPQAGKSKHEVEAFGRCFPSISALANDPRCVVDAAVLADRVRRGIEPEIAAKSKTMQRKPRLQKKVKGYKQYEFQGKKYRSLSALCRAFGVTRDIFRHRYNVKGWSMAEALNVEQRPRQHFTKPIMVDGVSYPSQREAAKAYGLTEFLLSSRLRRGLTPEQAVGLVPLHNKYAAKGITVQGTVFPSRMQAAKYFGVKYPTLVRRLNSGWSPEQAAELEPPPMRKGYAHQ